MKYSFEQYYQGPQGPHLAHRTKFTRTHELKEGGSCHPGRQEWGRQYNPTVDRFGDPIRKSMGFRRHRDATPQNPSRHFRNTDV